MLPGNQKLREGGDYKASILATSNDADHGDFVLLFFLRDAKLLGPTSMDILFVLQGSIVTVSNQVFLQARYWRDKTYLLESSTEALRSSSFSTSKGGEKGHVSSYHC